MKIKGVIKKTLAILIVFMVVATSVVIPVLTQAQERNEEETIDSKVVNTENGLIKKFDDLGEAKREQNVSLGTSFEDINLPNTLLATVERDGVLQHEEVNVNWESQPKFNSHISGLYTFSPSLTKGYSLDQGITIPQINLWVTMGVVPSSATIDISKEDMDFILPFGLVYDGNQQPNINVQGKGDFNEITGGLVTVFYEGDDYEKSQEPPKNAGTYQISINTTGGTKYKAAQDLVLGSYEIGKATGLVATQPGIIYLSSDDTNVKNYSLDQIQLTAPANCELGALSYATGNFNNDDGILANQPSISNKILSFKGIGGITGTATQVISISSANFETINVNLIFQSAWLEEAKININMPASQPYTNSLIAATASATDENTSQPVPDASFSYIYSGTTITGQHYYSSKMPMKPGDYSVTATLQSATHHGNKQQNFVIAKGTLQWSSGLVKNKSYDGSKIAEVDTATLGGMPKVQNIVTGDDVKVKAGSVSFSDKNVGASVSILANGWGIQGEDIGNYEVLSSQPSFANARIIPRVLDFTVTPTQRPYNGKSSVEVAITLNNKLTDDNVTITADGLLDNPNAGFRTVSLENLVLDGTDKNNYEIPSVLPTGEVNIPKVGGSFSFSGESKYSILESKTDQNSWDLSTSLIPNLTSPASSGIVNYSLISYEDAQDILNDDVYIENGTMLKFTGKGKNEGSATITLKVSSENYADFMMDVTIEATAKTLVSVNIVPQTITYGSALPTPQVTLYPVLNPIPNLIYSYSGRSYSGEYYGPTSIAPTEPGTYTLTVTLESDTHQGSGQANITINKIQLYWSSGGTVEDKDYDGKTTATIETMPQLDGILPSHIGTIDVEEGTAYFASSNAGNDIGVTGYNWKAKNASVATNNLVYYNQPLQPLFQNAKINPLQLTASGTAKNREYNGQNSVDVTLNVTNAPAGQSLVLSGKGNMANSDAGIGKEVIISDIKLSPNSSNYILPNSQDIGVTVDISRSTSGFLVTRPEVIFIPESDTGQHNFDLSTAFESSFIYSSGTLNYKLSENGLKGNADILQSAPSLIGNILTYQGAGKSTGTATQAITIESTNYVNIEVTLVFMSISENNIWQKADVNVNIPNLSTGINKEIEYGTPLGVPESEVKVNGIDLNAEYYSLEYSYEGVRLDGAIYGPTTNAPEKPGSYTLETILIDKSTGATHYYGSDAERFVINKKQLTWTTNGKVKDKEYDGSITASIAADGEPQLYGVISGDNVSAVKGIASFVNKNAADSIGVLGSGWGMKGTDILYYKAPTQPVFANAKIEPRLLKILNLTAANRQYNASKEVNISVTPENRVSTDISTLTLTMTGTVDDENVGKDKIVTTGLDRLTMTGASQANYIFPTSLPTTPIKMEITKTNRMQIDQPGINQISSDDIDAHDLNLNNILQPRSSQAGYQSGEINYALSTFTNSSGVLKALPTLDAQSGILTYLGGEKSSGTTTLSIIVSSQNFTDLSVNFQFKAFSKSTTTVNVTPPTGLVYGNDFVNPTAVALIRSDINNEFVFTYTGLDFAGNTYAKSTEPPKKPGNYSVTARLVNGTHAGTSSAANFTIDRKRLSWEGLGTVYSKEYDGNNNATVLKEPQLGGIQDEADDVAVTTGSVHFNSSDAGTHSVVAGTDWTDNITGNGLNYYLKPLNIPQFENGIINRRNITITSATAASKIYNGSNYANVTSVTLGGIFPGEEFTEADYSAIGEFVDVNAGSGKTINVRVVLNDSPRTKNYKIEDIAFELINQNIELSDLTGAIVDVSVAGEYRYSGNKNIPSSSDVTVTVDGRNLIYGTDYTFDVTDGGTQAGPVELTIIGKGNYSGLKAKPGVYTILKRPVKVIANSFAIQAGSSIPKFSYTLDGVVNGENVFKNTEPKLHCPTINLTKVGNYEIIVDMNGVEYNHNYEAAFPATKTGTLTINQSYNTSKSNTGGMGGNSTNQTEKTERFNDDSNGKNESGLVSDATEERNDKSSEEDQQKQDLDNKLDSKTTLLELRNSGVPIFKILGNEVPLFSKPNQSSWSLVNLFFTLIGIMLSVWLSFKLFIKKEKSDKIINSKKTKIFTAIVLGSTALSLIMFLITQKTSKLMVLLDFYTPWFTILFIIQLVLFLLLKKKNHAIK